MRRRALMVSAAFAVIACSVGLAAPAFAADEPGANATAQLIDRVAPDQGDVVTDVERVPVGLRAGSAVAPITDESGLRVGATGAPSLDIDLPIAESATAAVASDGTIVYEDGDTSVAVQAMTTGAVRVQTILASAADPHRIAYGLGNGYSPAQRSDGTWFAYRVTSEGAVAVFTIDRAWARDAEGRPVPTHYELEGSDLVQIVDHVSSTVYPIVADPTWKWSGLLYGLQFTRSETRQLAGVVGVSKFCEFIRGHAVLQVACYAFAAHWAVQASIAAREGTCLFLPAAPPSALALRFPC